MFFLALSPILWLILSLAFLKMPSQKACPAALLVAFAAAYIFFAMPVQNALTAALEGAALACWPILLVIIAAIFTYNLSLHTKSMDVIKQMLSSVSHDRRVLAILVGWGFGAFMEGMAGFGTAIAIPASMLAGMGFRPVTAIILCLVANSVPTSYGSIGIPTSTLAEITGMDPLLLAKYVSLQLLPLNIIVPFLMVMIVGGSVKAIKGVFWLTLAAGLGMAVPELLISMFLGPELAVMGASIFIMGAVIFCAKKFKIDDPDYRMDIKSERVPLKKAVVSCMAFILIFVFLLLTSKLVPFINEPLNMVRSSVQIYSGTGGQPYTFVWLATPGIFIFLAAFIGGKVQSASFSEMLGVLGKTLVSLRNTIITIITVIATAKVMSYSGMTAELAQSAVDVMGSTYPVVASLVGATGTFITGSGTSSNVLFGILQTDTAADIGANAAWLAAANAAGTSAGKMISPQSIAIASAAVGIQGMDSEILKQAVKFFIPFIIFMGCIVYFGQLIVG